MANQTSFRKIRAASPTTQAAMITTIGAGTAIASSCRDESASTRLATIRGLRGVTRRAIRPPSMEPAAIEVPMKPQADAPPSWSRAPSRYLSRMPAGSPRSSTWLTGSKI